MIDKDSLSYKKGFAKGIEIYTQNRSNGYYADEDNKRFVRAFRKYAETGFKKDIRLVRLHENNLCTLLLRR